MSLKPICVDDFGTLWYEVCGKGIITRRFACQVYSEWLQDQKFPCKGDIIKIINDGSIWDGSVLAVGWYQTCNIEHWVFCGIVIREEIAQLGFRMRW